MYRIGIDVGGTNTDACVLDVEAASSETRGFIAAVKTVTTVDVTTGIKNAVEGVLQKSGIDRDHVLNVAIGTTHFINAVVEADSKRLDRVAVIPPFADFPASLKSITAGPAYYLQGGLEIDGREIRPLDPAEVKATAAAIVKAGIKRVALVGVFSALDHDGRHEERCKKLMLEESPDLSIVCSHTIGGPGLLARENATILNASILALARRATAGYRLAMTGLGLTCPLYLTQNDGTLTDASTAANLPIKTFASGATNSMMGAAFLQGLDRTGSRADRQVLVVDIGGTTTDVGALLRSGYPRQAPNFVEVGGVRTAFSMPDVLSIGLGGGSRFRDDDGIGHASIGPDSVGHALTRDALVFGGSTVTATDIAVAAGNTSIGDPNAVRFLSAKVVADARKAIRLKLEKVIDNMKVSDAPVTVLLVGGGSVILTESLQGVAECVCPPHHDAANAVGAAIAKVAGEVDVIEVLAGKDETTVTEKVKRRAINVAVERGADRSDVKIVEFEKIPLQYVNNKATRLVMRAVGRLGAAALKEAQKTQDELLQQDKLDDTEDDLSSEEIAKSTEVSNSLRLIPREDEDVNIAQYRPDVRNGTWHLSRLDVKLIASGTGILGTGGGGSSYEAALHALDILDNDGKMRVISPKALKDSDLCVFGAGYGAPSVSNERIPSGKEIFAAIDGLNRVLGHEDFQAIVADEIGGGNGLATFPSSARYDRAIVDADLMGRAYPTMEHGTPYVYGSPITPCSMADASGNVSVVMSAESNTKIERMLRTTCVELGNSAAVCGAPLSGEEIKRLAIPNTLSQAWYLGRAVHLARRSKISPVKAIQETTTAKLLYSGKIVDVTRDVSQGYTVGRCVIAPNSAEELGGDGSNTTETRSLVIPFQNEFLYAAFVDPAADSGAEDVIATVPDLISVLGEDGEAIGSPELRYGLRVHVIGMPAHPLWTGTEQGLKVGGPEFFGLNMKWKSIGPYEMPRSVIDEFDASSLN